jgi:hypothetical protein
MRNINIKKAITIISYIVDITATIILVIFILNFDKPSNNKNLYMVESTVIDVSETNVVTVETIDNEIFSFKGNGVWLTNDGVILLLDNQGTETIKDDIIVDTLCER